MWSNYATQEKTDQSNHSCCSECFSFVSGQISLCSPFPYPSYFRWLSCLQFLFGSLSDHAVSSLPFSAVALPSMAFGPLALSGSSEDAGDFLNVCWTSYSIIINEKISGYICTSNTYKEHNYSNVYGCPLDLYALLSPWQRCMTLVLKHDDYLTVNVTDASKAHGFLNTPFKGFPSFL